MRDDLLNTHDPSQHSVEQPGAFAAQPVQSLRILATSDIHMQLLGHDYIADQSVGHAGLAGLATLVEDARAEAQAEGTISILIDNGDFLQGNALADVLAKMPVTADHPLIAVLGEMGYDAIGLGNHDLDHGVAYLCNLANLMPVPCVTSNLVPAGSAPFVRSALIRCARPHNTWKVPDTLTIGLISVLPERTAQWNTQELKDWAEIHPSLNCAQTAAEEVRAQGADIVILLAHLGVEGPVNEPVPQDDARHLAGVPGIDAVITGHTHRRLPGVDHAGYSGVDIEKGALHHRPAVMPGFEASDLAVLDLQLGWADDTQWHVLSHETQLRPNTGEVPAHPKISALCAPVHHATRAELAVSCGQTSATIHNYFTLAMPTATSSLEASAKFDAVRSGIAGTADANLPLLATASAHTAGGRGGPRNFLHIPAGTIYRRHLAGLSPFTNEICALKINGQELRDWLEHKAGVFSHLCPEKPDQPLRLDHRPSFDFDTVFGVDYTIDPSQPAGSRLVHLTYQGATVAAEQNFVLATNMFRAVGGGGGARFTSDQIIFRSTDSVPEALVHVLSSSKRQFPLNLQPWRFACATPVQAIIRTSPEALPYLNDIAHLSPQVLGHQEDGFMAIRCRF
ncbi:MAG: 5'-nucleotidase C-terminal domain-containing protein [Sulfitobacter sp.]